MRLTLWQQFSSNHSSDFTVVGRFQTAEEAEKAAEQLCEWMTKILYEGGNKGQLTDIERAISERYNLEWYEHGLDWNGTPDNVSDVVRRIFNDVILTCPLETWDSVTPFMGLMWKLGARRVSFAEHETYYLSAYIDCRAPDEATAEMFYNHTRQYLKGYFDLETPVYVPLWDTDNHDSACGAIARNGSRLRLELQFWEMGHDLSALIRYLEENGFTHIQYIFHAEMRWSERLIDSIWKWVEQHVKSEEGLN